MKTADYMQKTEANVLHTYNRFPIVLDHGEGVYLYDTEGKRYLDFAAGIAVCSLGYGNKALTEAVSNQAAKLLHSSNLYYSAPLGDAAAKLAEATGLSKVFFTNSGTEAVEGALKAARKYAFIKDGSTDHEIIAMRHSFHGRSLGALSVTGNEAYQAPFRPMQAGVRFATFNDLASVEAELSDKTCAIILEVVQGEGGIYPATKEFLEGIRALCDARDLVLIFDEIQCGMGRTGSLFAYQDYGVMPDIVTSAKALGCGVPVGAFVLNEKLAGHSLVPGDHGTTYGGDPLATAAVNAVFSEYERLDLVQHVRDLTPYLEAALDEVAEQSDFVLARRGKGFLQGLVIDPGKPVGEVIGAAREEGLLVISAEGNVLRMAPPLIISESEIDEMEAALTRALKA